MKKMEVQIEEDVFGGFGHSRNFSPLHNRNIRVKTLNDGGSSISYLQVT